MKRTSLKLGLLVTTLLVAPNCVADDEGALQYPPTLSLEDMRQWVDRAPKVHPRLLATGAELKALRRAVDEDPMRRMLADAVLAQAQDRGRCVWRCF